MKRSKKPVKCESDKTNSPVFGEISDVQLALSYVEADFKLSNLVYFVFDTFQVQTLDVPTAVWKYKEESFFFYKVSYAKSFIVSYSKTNLKFEPFRRTRNVVKDVVFQKAKSFVIIDHLLSRKSMLSKKDDISDHKISGVTIKI